MSVKGCLATALLTCLAGGSHCRAEDIRIRVIDVKTGQPVGGKRIRVDSANGNPERRRGPVLRTGHDGVAGYHLEPPLPQSLFVVLDMGGYTSWAPCSHLDFLVSRVLQAGVVAEMFPNFCGDGKDRQRDYTATPGEIVVFTQRYSWWKRWKDFPG